VTLFLDEVVILAPSAVALCLGFEHYHQLRVCVNVLLCISAIAHHYRFYRLYILGVSALYLMHAAVSFAHCFVAALDYLELIDVVASV